MGVLFLTSNKSKYKLFEIFCINKGINLEFISSEQSFLEEENKDWKAVLVDSQLEQQDSFHICEVLSNIASIPVLMVSGSEDSHMECLAFDVGCSDFIKPPYTFESIIKRIKNAMKKTQPPEKEFRQCQISEVTSIDIVGRSIWRDGEQIILTKREFDLLVFLIMADTRVVTRDQIIDELWNSRKGKDNRIVDVHIKNLRKKIPEANIYTVSGIGYRLIPYKK